MEKNAYKTCKIFKQMRNRKIKNEDKIDLFV